MENMLPAFLIAAVAAIIGAVCAVVGTYWLAGGGWALICASGLCFALCAVLMRGLRA